MSYYWRKQTLKQFNNSCDNYVKNRPEAIKFVKRWETENGANEFSKLIKMNYQQVYKYLRNKYQKPSGSYFCNKSCKSPNPRIKRSSEGLQIHHIAENKIPALSERRTAQNNAWKYQTPNYLVYCNLLEHTLLHFKIWEEVLKNRDLDRFDSGINGNNACSTLAGELNDFYSGFKPKTNYAKTKLEAVKNLKQQYMLLIRYLIKLQITRHDFYKTSFNNTFDRWSIKNNDALFNEFEEVINSNN